ncbi:MAG: hypothetical protein HY763_12160 [Planctomycetes bacterium]|nr:hypothetical protein [Planctomycetota bacterium]
MAVGRAMQNHWSGFQNPRRPEDCTIDGWESRSRGWGYAGDGGDSGAPTWHAPLLAPGVCDPIPACRPIVRTYM